MSFWMMVWLGPCVLIHILALFEAWIKETKVTLGDYIELIGFSLVPIINILGTLACLWNILEVLTDTDSEDSVGKKVVFDFRSQEVKREEQLERSKKILGQE